MTVRFTIVASAIPERSAVVSLTRIQKLTEMINEGKTDGSCVGTLQFKIENGVEVVESFTGVRTFRDQAAAEEYRDFYLPMVEAGGVTVFSINIEEI
jgi:hypothetical protein